MPPRIMIWMIILALDVWVWISAGNGIQLCLHWMYEFELMLVMEFLIESVDINRGRPVHQYVKEIRHAQGRFQPKINRWYE